MSIFQPNSISTAQPPHDDYGIGRRNNTLLYQKNSSVMQHHRRFFKARCDPYQLLSSSTSHRVWDLGFSEGYKPVRRSGIHATASPLPFLSYTSTIQPSLSSVIKKDLNYQGSYKESSTIPLSEFSSTSFQGNTQQGCKYTSPLGNVSRRNYRKNPSRRSTQKGKEHLIPGYSDNRGRITLSKLDSWRLQRPQQQENAYSLNYHPNHQSSLSDPVDIVRTFNQERMDRRHTSQEITVSDAKMIRAANTCNTLRRVPPLSSSNESVDIDDASIPPPSDRSGWSHMEGGGVIASPVRERQKESRSFNILSRERDNFTLNDNRASSIGKRIKVTDASLTLQKNRQDSQSLPSKNISSKGVRVQQTFHKIPLVASDVEPKAACHMYSQAENVPVTRSEGWNRLGSIFFEVARHCPNFATEQSLFSISSNYYSIIKNTDRQLRQSVNDIVQIYNDDMKMVRRFFTNLPSKLIKSTNSIMGLCLWSLRETFYQTFGTFSCEGPHFEAAKVMLFGLISHPCARLIVIREFINVQCPILQEEDSCRSSNDTIAKYLSIALLQESQAENEMKSYIDLIHSKSDWTTVVEILLEVLILFESKIHYLRYISWFTSQIPWLLDLAVNLDTLCYNESQSCSEENRNLAHFKISTTFIGWLAACLVWVGPTGMSSFLTSHSLSSYPHVDAQKCIFWSNIFEQNINSLAIDRQFYAPLENLIATHFQVKLKSTPSFWNYNNPRGLLRQSLLQYWSSRKHYRHQLQSSPLKLSHAPAAQLIVCFVETSMSFIAKCFIERERRVQRRKTSPKKSLQSHPLTSSSSFSSMDKNTTFSNYCAVVECLIFVSFSVWSAAFIDPSISSSTRRILVNLFERITNEDNSVKEQPWRSSTSLALAECVRYLERLTYSPATLSRMKLFFKFETKVEVGQTETASHPYTVLQFFLSTSRLTLSQRFELLTILMKHDSSRNLTGRLARKSSSVQLSLLVRDALLQIIMKNLCICHYEKMSGQNVDSLAFRSDVQLIPIDEPIRYANSKPQPLSSQRAILTLSFRLFSHLVHLVGIHQLPLIGDLSPNKSPSRLNYNNGTFSDVLERMKHLNISDSRSTQCDSNRKCPSLCFCFLWVWSLIVTSSIVPEDGNYYQINGINISTSVPISTFLSANSNNDIIFKLMRAFMISYETELANLEISKTPDKHSELPTSEIPLCVAIHLLEHIATSGLPLLHYVQLSKENQPFAELVNERIDECPVVYLNLLLSRYPKLIGVPFAISKFKPAITLVVVMMVACLCRISHSLQSHTHRPIKLFLCKSLTRGKLQITLTTESADISNRDTISKLSVQQWTKSIENVVKLLTNEVRKDEQMAEETVHKGILVYRSLLLFTLSDLLSLSNEMTFLSNSTIPLLQALGGRVDRLLSFRLQCLFLNNWKDLLSDISPLTWSPAISKQNDQSHPSPYAKTPLCSTVRERRRWLSKKNTSELPAIRQLDSVTCLFAFGSICKFFIRLDDLSLCVPELEYIDCGDILSSSIYSLLPTSSCLPPLRAFNRRFGKLKPSNFQAVSPSIVQKNPETSLFRNSSCTSSPLESKANRSPSVSSVAWLEAARHASSSAPPPITPLIGNIFSATFCRSPITSNKPTDREESASTIYSFCPLGSTGIPSDRLIISSLVTRIQTADSFRWKIYIHLLPLLLRSTMKVCFDEAQSTVMSQVLSKLFLTESDKNGVITRLITATLICSFAEYITNELHFELPILEDQISSLSSLKVVLVNVPTQTQYDFDSGCDPLSLREFIDNELKLLQSKVKEDGLQLTESELSQLELILPHLCEVILVEFCLLVARYITTAELSKAMQYFTQSLSRVMSWLEVDANQSNSCNLSISLTTVKSSISSTTEETTPILHRTFGRQCCTLRRKAVSLISSWMEVLSTEIISFSPLYRAFGRFTENFENRRNHDHNFLKAYLFQRIKKSCSAILEAFEVMSEFVNYNATSFSRNKLIDSTETENTYSTRRPWNSSPSARNSETPSPLLDSFKSPSQFLIWNGTPMPSELSPGVIQLNTGTSLVNVQIDSLSRHVETQKNRAHSFPELNQEILRAFPKQTPVVQPELKIKQDKWSNQIQGLSPRLIRDERGVREDNAIVAYQFENLSNLSQQREDEHSFLTKSETRMLPNSNNCNQVQARIRSNPNRRMQPTMISTEVSRKSGIGCNIFPSTPDRILQNTADIYSYGRDDCMLFPTESRKDYIAEGTGVEQTGDVTETISSSDDDLSKGMNEESSDVEDDDDDDDDDDADWVDFETKDIDVVYWKPLPFTAPKKGTNTFAKSKLGNSNNRPAGSIKEILSRATPTPHWKEFITSLLSQSSDSVAEHLRHHPKEKKYT